MVLKMAGHSIWSIIFDMDPLYVHFTSLSAHSGPFYMIYHFNMVSDQKSGPVLSF